MMLPLFWLLPEFRATRSWRENRMKTAVMEAGVATTSPADYHDFDLSTGEFLQAQSQV